MKTTVVVCEDCGVEYVPRHECKPPKPTTAEERAQHDRLRQVFRDGGQPLATLVTRYVAAERELLRFVSNAYGQPLGGSYLGEELVLHFADEIPEELLGPEFFEEEEQ